MFPFPNNTVEMKLRVKTGVDRLGNDVFAYNSHTIAGAMLVTSSTAEEAQPRELNDSVFVELHLPKTFTHSVAGATFEALDGPFKGRVFKVHGDPMPMENIFWLPWNRHARAEQVSK